MATQLQKIGQVRQEKPKLKLVSNRSDQRRYAEPDRQKLEYSQFVLRIYPTLMDGERN